MLEAVRQLQLLIQLMRATLEAPPDRGWLDLDGLVRQRLAAVDCLRRIDPPAWGGSVTPQTEGFRTTCMEAIDTILHLDEPLVTALRARASRLRSDLEQLREFRRALPHYRGGTPPLSPAFLERRG